MNSGYYPEGGMMGSGIYSVDVVLPIDCPECNHEWKEDLVTDDWGGIDCDVVCPKCNYEFNFVFDR